MDIVELAKRWIEIDNSDEHDEIIEEKLAENDQTWLQEHFGSRLSFGTAGLRGKMGPGTNAMNRGMVQQTSLGIAHVVKAQFPNQKPAVVIGFDARHRSALFAKDAAEVFASQGFTVHFYQGLCATPFLSYAVTKLQTHVGVMITASHNPAQDNGYKVYWSNGAQIISPQDQDIAQAIEKIADVCVWKSLRRWSDYNIQLISEELVSQYFAEIAKLRVLPKTGAKIIYSAMHGVGTPWIQRILHQAGHDFVFVKEQADADGDFPTVRFPNPEEDGALDLSMALAENEQADAILANDPDADRLAVAIPNTKGQWIKLSGDQIGLLLADYLLEYGQWGKNPMVATSLVSSSLLQKLAQEKNIAYVETLTGFKWIANQAIKHEKTAGSQFVMGFEEALGYCIGSVARDKDGISAVLLMADLLSDCKEKNETLWNRLSSLYQRLGFSLSKQKSLTKPGTAGKAEIAKIMEQIRQNPPKNLANSKIIQTRDYLKQKSNAVDGVEKELDLPKSNVLAFDLENGDRVIIRPSGTEPKIKFYLEATKPLNHADEYEKTQQELLLRLEELQTAILCLATSA